MKKVIFDCDNTMGIEGCDVDDGLALLYLLGKEEAIDIIGITSTYGNSNVEAVYANTALMLEDLGRTDIPLFKGCPDQDTLNSEAASFIVETVDRFPNKISILATGSLTNLLAAYLLDSKLLEKVSEIVIMGGLTGDLVINGNLLAELNLSCDPAASECILTNGHRVSLITGNNCLAAFFTAEQFQGRLAASSAPVARYIDHTCTYWFKNMMARFQIEGFHCWDVVAAAFLANPSLFSSHLQYLTPDSEKLDRGLLTKETGTGKPRLLNLPTIENLQQFEEDVYDAWLKVNLNAG
jgi:purine nucleosidase